MEDNPTENMTILSVGACSLLGLGRVLAGWTPEFVNVSRDSYILTAAPVPCDSASGRHIEEEMMFVFVTGCMRTGTSLLANWLGAALPGPTVALRETQVTTLGHQMMTVLELNQRQHSFGFSVAPESPLRNRVVESIRQALRSIYASYGVSSDHNLVDKQPYALSDAAAYYDHLYELFPDVRVIATIRAPEPTVRSMQGRLWGRGPWPKAPLISPVYANLTDLENLLGDLNPDGSPAKGPAAGKRAWSVKKSCLHYELAVTGLAQSQVGKRGFIIDYDSLGAPNASRAIADYLGTELKGTIPFTPKAKPSIDPKLQEEISEFIGDAGKVYRSLRERSQGLLSNA